MLPSCNYGAKNQHGARGRKGERKGQEHKTLRSGRRLVEGQGSASLGVRIRGKDLGVEGLGARVWGAS